MHSILSSTYHTLSDQELNSILTNADGNPLFAHVLAQQVHLEDRGALPDVIQAVFEQILKQVSSACRQLLSRVAVAKKPFSFSLAQNLGRLEEESTLEILEEALRANILEEEGSGTQIIYRFRHPLLAQYLAASVSATRRNWIEQQMVDTT